MGKRLVMEQKNDGKDEKVNGRSTFQIYSFYNLKLIAQFR